MSDQNALFGEERRDHILRVLARQGSVKVADLSQALGCSEATLRRDLQVMEDGGLLRRTHGGAVRPRAEPTMREPSPHERALLCAEEKQAIGRAAAMLVTAGDVVALNGGSTNVQVARALRQIGNLRIVTNSIGVAAELAGQPNVEVTVTGGALRGSLELYGPHAEQMLRNLFMRIAFLGVDGLSPRHGLTTFSQLEAHTNQVIISRAERVVVVADHTKIGRATMALIEPCSAMHILITDAAAPEDELAALREAGIEVIIAT